MDEEGCCAKLRLSFDPGLLARDLDRLRRVGRIRQPGTYHNGEWVGISLRSAGGTPSARPSLPALAPFEYSALLQRTPYFRKVLRTLRVPQLSVRLLFLPPGGVIQEHIDDIHGFWHGLLRLHLPIVTDPDVRFMIGNRRCDMAPGDVWYGDFGQKHSVVNESSITRVHMVIDVLINDFLLDLFPRGFVKRHAGGGITRYRPPLAPSRRKLTTYRCTFVVPAQLVSMLAPILRLGASSPARSLVEEASRTGVLARVLVANDQLFVAALGRRLLRLVPLTRDTCALADWPLGVMLHFDRRGESIRGLRLELRLPSGAGPSPESEFVPLPVLEEA